MAAVLFAEPTVVVLGCQLRRLASDFVRFRRPVQCLSEHLGATGLTSRRSDFISFISRLLGWADLLVGPHSWLGSCSVSQLAATLRTLSDALASTLAARSRSTSSVLSRRSPSLLGALFAGRSLGWAHVATFEAVTHMCRQDDGQT